MIRSTAFSNTLAVASVVSVFVLFVFVAGAFAATRAQTEFWSRLPEASKPVGEDELPRLVERIVRGDKTALYRVAATFEAGEGFFVDAPGGAISLDNFLTRLVGKGDPIAEYLYAHMLAGGDEYEDAAIDAGFLPALLEKARRVEKEEGAGAALVLYRKAVSLGDPATAAFLGERYFPIVSDHGDMPEIIGPDISVAYAWRGIAQTGLAGKAAEENAAAMARLERILFPEEKQKALEYIAAGPEVLPPEIPAESRSHERIATSKSHELLEEGKLHLGSYLRGEERGNPQTLEKAASLFEQALTSGPSPQVESECLLYLVGISADADHGAALMGNYLDTSLPRMAQIALQNPDGKERLVNMISWATVWMLRSEGKYRHELRCALLCVKEVPGMDQALVDKGIAAGIAWNAANQ